MDPLLYSGLDRNPSEAGDGQLNYVWGSCGQDETKPNVEEV